MKTLKERIVIEQKAADGEFLQWISSEYKEWNTIEYAISEDFIFQWDGKDYRIKPKPLEFYAVVLEGGTVSICNNSKEYLEDIMSADKCRKLTYKIVKAREVIEND